MTKYFLTSCFYRIFTGLAFFPLWSNLGLWSKVFSRGVLFFSLKASLMALCGLPVLFCIAMPKAQDSSALFAFAGGGEEEAAFDDSDFFSETKPSLGLYAQDDSPLVEDQGGLNEGFRSLAGSKKNNKLKIRSLADLQELTPHRSVSVIQKRYLPKTFRGEFNFSLTSAINHTYFYLIGARVAAGWFLREDHGFGIEGLGFLPARKKNLSAEMEAPPNGICVSTNVFSKYYFGLYYKWSPVFGKFTLGNKKIIYFDMYMTLNGGMGKLFQGPKEDCPQEGDSGVLPDKLFPSGGLGMGQIFALSQNWAFNWDLKWAYTMYNFVVGGQQSSKKHDMGINLLIGFNYYFPGAGYR